MTSITVVVTRYAESDEVILSCLESLRRQIIPVHINFLDQNSSAKVKQFCSSNNNCTATIDYETIPAKSLSYSRNYGLNKAKTRFVAFCDADCILDSQWSKCILEAFEYSQATIIGTKIVPDWEIKPSWYMKTKYVRDFYSVLDLGEGIRPIPKVIGASFSIDKNRIDQSFFFDENLGRQNGRLLGGEETDLCCNVRKSGGKVYYTSYAVAKHQIQKARISFNWLQKRVFYGGVSRAIRGGRVEPFSARTSFVDKIGILPFLPAYFAGFIYGLLLAQSHD